MAAQRRALTEQDIKVREVTHHQFSWTESSPGDPGTFSLQLILDQGSEEVVLRLTADDADTLHDLLHSEGRIYFDLERRVLMFGVTSST